jgi:hypothetical protein
MNMMLYAKEFQMILSCNHLSDSNFYLTLNFLLKISAATRGVSPSRLRIRAAMGRACYAIQIKPIFQKRSRLFGCSIPLEDVCLLALKLPEKSVCVAFMNFSTFR